MKRYARDNSEPMLKTVKRIELSEKNIKLRLILTIAALVVAVAAIGFGVHSCLSADSGWTTIDATTGADNLSYEFKLVYNLGTGKTSATVERKAVAAAYTTASVEAYKLFDPYAPEGYLKQINEHPGEEIEVPHELYSAFEKMLRHNRMLYMEPLNEMYEQLFGQENDSYAELADPDKSPYVKQIYEETVEFIQSDDNVRLELLGSDNVKLVVSDAYKAFAQEHESECYIGFGWLKNAFAADHIASRLTSAGYIHGYLTSVDGYSAYLDGDVNAYDVNLYSTTADGMSIVCTVGGVPAMFSANLRRFPISHGFGGYVYEDGTVVMPYVDASGAHKMCADVLYAYSEKSSCAETALAAADIFLSDTVEKAGLLSAESGGIHILYIGNGVIGFTDESASVTNVHPDFKTELIK